MTETKEEIREMALKIPALAQQGMRKAEVAEVLGWSVRKLDYWTARLNAEGIKVSFLRGRRPIELK